MFCPGSFKTKLFKSSLTLIKLMNGWIHNSISHLMYADDVMLFTKANKKFIIAMNIILEEFTAFTGLKVKRVKKAPSPCLKYARPGRCTTYQHHRVPRKTTTNHLPRKEYKQENKLFSYLVFKEILRYTHSLVLLFSLFPISLFFYFFIRQIPNLLLNLRPNFYFRLDQFLCVSSTSFLLGSYLDRSCEAGRCHCFCQFGHTTEACRKFRQEEVRKSISGWVVDGGWSTQRRKRGRARLRFVFLLPSSTYQRYVLCLKFM